jgi:hypothetical protein
LDPPGRTDEIFKAELPELVTVMVCAALEFPWIVLAKVRLAGTRVTAGSGDTPVPLSGIDCGLPGAFPRRWERTPH